MPPEIASEYDQIMYEATKNLPRWLDPSSALQENYPASTVEIERKK